MILNDIEENHVLLLSTIHFACFHVFLTILYLQFIIMKWRLKSVNTKCSDWALLTFNDSPDNVFGPFPEIKKHEISIYLCTFAHIVDQEASACLWHSEKLYICRYLYQSLNAQRKVVSNE